MSPVLFLKRPTAWLDAISRYRGSISFAPNFAYELCLRRVKLTQIESLDLSSWRVAGCGAEPIRHDTLMAFAERFSSAGFKAASFVPSYGLRAPRRGAAAPRRQDRFDRFAASSASRGRCRSIDRRRPATSSASSAARAFRTTRSGSWTAARRCRSARWRIVARGPPSWRLLEDRSRRRNTARRLAQTGDLGYLPTVNCSLRRTKISSSAGEASSRPESAIATVDAIRRPGSSCSASVTSRRRSGGGARGARQQRIR